MQDWYKMNTCTSFYHLIFNIVLTSYLWLMCNVKAKNSFVYSLHNIEYIFLAVFRIMLFNMMWNNNEICSYVIWYLKVTFTSVITGTFWQVYHMSTVIIYTSYNTEWYFSSKYICSYCLWLKKTVDYIQT